MGLQRGAARLQAAIRRLRRPQRRLWARARRRRRRRVIAMSKHTGHNHAGRGLHTPVAYIAEVDIGMAYVFMAHAVGASIEVADV